VARAAERISWWAATLFILSVCLYTCQPPPAYAIYSCASPEEVYESATSRGWIYVKISKSRYDRTELWTKNGRFVEVYYKSSRDVDYKRLCYAGETGHLHEDHTPGLGYNPNPFGGTA
jgi:hypothetical protein